MGRLVDGQWVKTSIISSDEKGGYDRLPRTFFDTIGKNHPTFQPESGRYHLYVSHACPWAHRTLIYRELKDLKSHITVDVVHPDMCNMGWTFSKNYPDSTGDRLFDSQHLMEIYQKAQPDVSTSVTVPVLWDRLTNTIVNNESSQIIRIFDTAFSELTGNTENYYPQKLQKEIDTWNQKIYHHVNNGVYRCGFARTQNAYNEAVTGLFGMLDELDQHLEGKDYLVGQRLTEADLRLIPTLLRFDIVYFTHFKTNLRMIRDYKNLSRYTEYLFGMDAIKTTTNFAHIKRHYYYSHESINPYRIVPVGPAEIPGSKSKDRLDSS